MHNIRIRISTLKKKRRKSKFSLAYVATAFLKTPRIFPDKSLSFAILRLLGSSAEGGTANGSSAVSNADGDERSPVCPSSEYADSATVLSSPLQFAILSEELTKLVSKATVSFCCL